jgi:acyl-CoA synthetase (AMP-forming)/AMP-acid ligase II/acyl carrier protein
MKLLIDQHPEKIFAFDDKGIPFSYGELQHFIFQLSVFLDNQKSSRVGIIFPNGLEFAITLLGVCQSGTAIPFNPAYSFSEYINYFSLARLDVLLIWKGFENHPSILAAKEKNLPIKYLDPAELIHKKNESTFILEKEDEDRICLVLLTSGSTGNSKLVPLSIKNLTNNALQVASSVHLTAEDTCLCMWEQFHIGGVVDLLLAPMLSGGKIVFAGSYNGGNFFDWIQRFPITWSQVVPTSLNDLNKISKSRPFKASNLKFIRCVAAALPKSWEEEFVNIHKIPVIKTYGMTEASPLITSTFIEADKNKPGSVGKSCGTLIRVFPIDKENQIGEIGIKGDNVFKGYENENQKLSFKEGWFLTGDLGYIDDEDYLFLTGRVKELINRGGEKIAPFEVEEVLIQHQEIMDVAVSAYFHPTLGEAVGALVVSKLSSEFIIDFCKPFLAPFKIPSKIVSIESIPRNALGKKDLIKIKEILDTWEENNPNKNSPKNEIECIVLELWRIELENQDIQLNDDFLNSGGDSLSFTRIIVALEEILDIKVPAKLMEKNWTVRLFSIEIEKVIPNNRSKEIVWIGNNEIRHRFLAQIANEIKEFEKIEINYLSAQPDYLSFEKARHLCESILTGYELNTLASKVLENKPFWKFRIKRKARSLINSNIKYEKWYRKKISPFSILYKQIGKTNKKLVIGFTSIAMRLGTPTVNILEALQDLDVDFLMLLDPNRAFFEKGIPEIGENYFDIAGWLKTFAQNFKYENLVVIGTSAGGLSAIIVGSLLKCEKIIAVGCDKPSYHPGIVEFLKFTSLNELQKIMLGYSQKVKRDREAVLELKNIFKNLETFSNPKIKVHSYFDELNKMKMLSKFFENVI